MKPSREIFALVTAGVGAAARDCIFLDDTPHNVEGARVAGLQAHLFSEETYPEIEKALAPYA